MDLAAHAGDLGISWSNRADIGPMLADGLKNTALLALMASLFSLPIGFITALIAVIYRGSIFDRVTSGMSLAIIAMPEFLIAYLLMTFLVVSYPVFPAHTIFADEMSPERLHAMFLPAATLAVAGLAGITGEPRLFNERPHNRICRDGATERRFCGARYYCSCFAERPATNH